MTFIFLHISSLNPFCQVEESEEELPDSETDCVMVGCYKSLHQRKVDFHDFQDSMASDLEMQTNNGGSEKANDNNVASFLGQMLLQQQEMMQQIQQQAQQQKTEQMQFQQHMLQMIARMNGATESRPVSTTVQQPLNYRQVI